jgi:high-affinity iron transporter
MATLGLCMVLCLAVGFPLAAQAGSTGTKTGGAAPGLATLAARASQAGEKIRASDQAGADAALKLLDEEWDRVEDGVRAADASRYGRIETGIAQARAAVHASPADFALAAAAVGGIQEAIRGAAAGTPTAAPGGSALQGAVAAVPGPATAAASIQDLMSLLEETRDSLRRGDGTAASASLQAFTEAWPAAEGAVRSASASAYGSVENAMIEAQAQLLSGPSSREAATKTVQGMIDTLAALGGGGRYTAIDAGLVLLREGLEALLVLVALLAMLSKSGQQKGKAYVWTGAGAGLLLSIALAVLLRVVLSASAGGMARESLEGFVGLVAVALMLTVGAWLHRNSSIKAWNAYIKSRVGDAIAAGRQWSLFAVAGLAILREGAETVIFLAGMAPFLSTLQLIAGIGGALVLLAAAGFAVIRFSVRLPIHHLFLVATIVIFYLAFKIAGESVHALQIAGILPARFSVSLPSVGFLGMFPTWETFVLQLAIALIVVTQIVVTEARRAR